MDKAKPAKANAAIRQSSMETDSGPPMNHGTAVLPNILAASKQGYIKDKCTSRPSACNQNRRQ